MTALVRACAVLGDGANVAEAAGLAGIPVDAAARCADLLIARSILKRADGIEFAHSIVREAASESASEAGAHIERVLADGRLLKEQDIDVVGPFYALVNGLLATDALDFADACVEQALVDARARASIPAMAFLFAHRGWFSLRRGALARAEADARCALELLSDHDIRLGNRFALALLIWVMIERGELDEAEQALRHSGLGEEIPPGLAANDLLQARGALRLAQGETQAGLDDLFEFGRRDELWGGANELASRWRSRACLTLAAAGERERAPPDHRGPRAGAAMGGRDRHRHCAARDCRFREVLDGRNACLTDGVESHRAAHLSRARPGPSGFRRLCAERSRCRGVEREGTSSATREGTADGRSRERRALEVRRQADQGHGWALHRNQRVGAGFRRRFCQEAR